MSIRALKIIEEEEQRFFERNKGTNLAKFSAIETMLDRIKKRMDEEELLTRVISIDDGQEVLTDDDRRAREVEIYECGVANGRAMRKQISDLTTLTAPEGLCITTEQELKAFSRTEERETRGTIDGRRGFGAWLMRVVRRAVLVPLPTWFANVGLEGGMGSKLAYTTAVFKFYAGVR